MSEKNILIDFFNNYISYVESIDPNQLDFFAYFEHISHPEYDVFKLDSKYNFFEYLNKDNESEEISKSIIYSFNECHFEKIINIKRLVKEISLETDNPEFHELLEKMEFELENGLIIISSLITNDYEFDNDLFYKFSNNGQKTAKKCIKEMYKKLEPRFAELKKYIEKYKNKTPKQTKNLPLHNNYRVVIQWNENKNVLTNIFKQLKNIPNKEKEPVIGNGIEEIAIFLKENFSCFENTKIGTIVTMLKQNENTPKKTTRRIIIEKEK